MPGDATDAIHMTALFPAGHAQSPHLSFCNPCVHVPGGSCEQRLFAEFKQHVAPKRSQSDPGPNLVLKTSICFGLLFALPLQKESGSFTARPLGSPVSAASTSHLLANFPWVGGSGRCDPSSLEPGLAMNRKRTWNSAAGGR